MRSKILCIDDGRTLGSLYESTIAKCNSYEYFKAGNGLHAYQKLRSAPKAYDLLVFNINMRGMTGIELLRKMRIKMKCDTQVLIITDLKDREIINSVLSLKISGLLLLPCEKKQVFDKVNEILEPQQGKLAA